MAIINTCVWIGKKVTYAGVIRARIRGVYANGLPVSSGYVLGTTKLIFRSESAKFFVFLQLSREMWEFAEDSELMVEKAVQGFLPELFAKWKDSGANHVVTIVLFTRIFYDGRHPAEDDSADPAVTIDPCTGRLKKDFFRVVADFESRSDWTTVLPIVKRAIGSFAESVLCSYGSVTAAGGGTFVGSNSRSEEGCVLEAINLALNSFDRHYVDRDLLRTGLSIVLVTPGSGTFKVNEPVFRLTSQRMVDNGIGLDLVCLSPPPLYTAPLFQFFAGGAPRSVAAPAEKSEAWSNDNRGYDDAEDTDGLESDLFVIPHWIDLSFWTRAGTGEVSFLSRAKLDDCQNLYIVRSAGDDIVLGRGFAPQEVSGMDQAAHDAGAFLVQGHERDAASDRPAGDAIQLSIDGPGFSPRKGSENADSGDVLTHGLPEHGQSPERPRQALLGAMPISIRPKLKPAGSQASSFDERFRDSSLSSLPRGTPMSRFRKPSPGKQASGAKATVKSGDHLNPYNPSKNLLRMTAHIRRWHHIFPKLEQYAEDDPAIKWVSLSTPACLPLTTDFFPNTKQLAERYHEYSYILSPFIDEANMFVDFASKDVRNLDALLMELVYHRLAQGFQIIVFTGSVDISFQKGPSVKGAASGSFNRSLSASEVDRKAVAMNDTGMWMHSSLGKHIYLSLGDHVHHLTYDSLAQNIEVKRYVRKASRAAATASFHFGIWPREGPEFRSVSVRFEDARLTNYNWNYLDHLIAGYQEELTDSLRFWRTRFLLIPMDAPPLQSSLMLATAETLDEEELRLAGFSKFLEVFEKARWLSPSEKRATESKAAKPQGVQVNLTTFSTAGYVAHEWLKGSADDPAGRAKGGTAAGSGQAVTTPLSDAAGKEGPLTRQSSLPAIAAAMQQPGAVPFKDRRWHFRLYEGTFLGSECVDWMMQAFSDIDSREAAISFGDELLDKGLFIHVNQKHRFLDGYYYYRLKEEFAPPRSMLAKGLRWLAGGKQNATADVSSNKPKGDGGSDALLGSSKATDPQPGSTEPVTPSTARHVVELSRSLIVDMDPQKRSNRRELAIVHYDTVHNPKACYHFQLHWLSCTARLMEDMLSSWARTADKCGLRMVEAPVEQIQEFSPDNPFRSVSVLHLSVEPPLREEVKRTLALEVDIPVLWFEMEFLRSQGFIIDVEADDRFPKNSTLYSYRHPPHTYTQFVHRTGLVFIQLLGPGKGFLWANNRFLTSNSSSVMASRGAASSSSADLLWESFRAACSDKAGLVQFWEQCQARLTSLPTDLLEDCFTASVADGTFQTPG
ncbi:hypothetical protein DFJ74DRAFT_645665 [Hyaloraphidium curvatum]|nr:hypothetical protein DFJ74DRAFT_645665 [Hyaloraphidium curvatum]